ncbi:MULTISPECIES: PBP1A family penicillin-binding protein, partial [Bacillus]|uniref:PBP1A family penicillin-binding protein n=1 Tax=Bacillus TaxID=1386 RepID=UPI0003792CD2
MADKIQTREERRKNLQRSKKKNKNNKSSKSLFKKIMLSLLILIGIGIVGGAATFAYFVSSAPELDEALLKDPISSKIYDVDKKLVKEVGLEKRNYVKYEDIPDIVKDAVIATEDSRFYKHHGVDPFRLASAVVANFTSGFGSQGASTITQQLVKRSFLTDEKTLKRKAQELWLSFQIERKYSKEEIFEMYINKIFYGARANGVATAAEVYFDKSLDELTLPEAATLAGLPQSPTRYNPFNHPERAEKRRNVVLQLMNKHGYISESEMKEAQSVKITDSLLPEDERQQEENSALNSFVDTVLDEIETKTDYNPFTDGLEIYTTLDQDAQNYVYKMLNTDEVVSFPNDEMQAGITLLDTSTGEIRAIGGGRNQKVQRPFNFATEQKRQPGSTIKPILDYGPAVEYLKWSTYEQIVDEPYSYSDGTPINNYNNRHQGQMTIRTALAKSLNIPALKAFQAVGADKSREFGEKLGLDFKDDFHESSSIGGMKYGFSSKDMAGAYSAFGNEGIYNEPHTVKKIVLADKKTKIDLTPEPKVAMKDYTAFMITDMLKTVVQSGTGTLANVPGLPVAGKTGTTNYSEDERNKFGITDPAAVPDAWFVGYTTKYTAAVWTGYEKKKEYLGSKSQKLAQKMFKNLMSHVSENVDTKDFSKPKSVVKVGIEKGSNPAKLPSPFTPKDNITYEYFVKGTEPTEVSETYDKLDAPTNLNVSYDDTTKQATLTWSYPEVGEDQQKPVFEVKQSIDGGGETAITTTDKMEAKVSNPEAGKTYKFSVVAVVGDLKSDPASVTIKIPDPLEEEEQPGDDEDSNIENPDDNGDVDNPDNPDNPTTPPNEDSGNGNNGNGNSNGNNGNGNGNSNGNNGNGNGNGNTDGNANGNNNNQNPSKPNGSGSSNSNNSGGVTQNSTTQSQSSS